MSDEDAKSAPQGDVESIRKVLGYWQMLAFLSQGDIPKESSVEGDKKDKKDKKASFPMIDRFAPAAADVGDEERTLVSLVEERLDKIVEPEDRDKVTDRTIFVHLGRIPREPVVAYLFKAWGADDARVEPESGEMAAAILGLTGEGKLDSFKLSPLLWLTGEGSNAEADKKRYDTCGEKIMERLKAYTSPLTISDVRQIVRREIIDPYLRPIADYQRQRQLEEAVKASQAESSRTGKREAPKAVVDLEECANALLFDCQVRAEEGKAGKDQADTKEERDYKVSFEGFYSEDIAALSDCFKGASSLDELREGPLALVTQYLEAGLEEQAAQRREGRRKSVLPTDASDNEDCLEVYRDKMGYGAMPLGRWPSRYSLSFMQQLGVNLVAPGFAEFDADEGGWQGGRGACDESRAHYDAPQRIWSVNGPPGTGKTTLLKDIVAANVVEKARLLCKYDDPDQAFEDEPIAFPDRKGGYIAGCDGVFHLRDDEVSDLGIVVCSSNNAAVENISKELPKAEGLLAGVDEAERKAFLDEADPLAHVEWCPRGADAGEPKETRDLYFSFPAHYQFCGQRGTASLKYYHDEDDANLDLLLAARLGKKSNIGDFVHGSLSTLYWNAPYWGGRKPSAKECADQLKRYKKAREEFRDQYEKVERELAVFAEYERLARKLEEAEEGCKQAQTKSEELEQQCLSAREDDLGTLRDIARRCGLDVEDSALATPKGLESLCDELVRRAKTYEADRELCEDELDIAKESLAKAENAYKKAEGELRKAENAREKAKDAHEKAENKYKKVEDASFLIRLLESREANEAVARAKTAVDNADEAVARAKTAVDNAGEAVDRKKTAVAKAERALKVFEAGQEKEACCAQGAGDMRRVLNRWYENEDKRDAARTRADKLARKADDLKQDCGHLAREAKAQRARLEGPDPQFLHDDSGDLSDGGFDYDGFIAALTSEDDDTRKQAHLFNPISNPDILRDRDLLFIKALRLTREFILASRCMKSNLRYLMAYWGSKDIAADSGKPEVIRLSDKDAQAVVPALFQSLNLLTPVISTTFASAQRLFKDIPITGERADAPLGLLVIDEAGQALPYAALGVLARCRRAMVVGDPFQIEPVVAQEAKVLRPVLAKDIPLAYKQDCASVQRLADAANPYGQSRKGEDGDSTWVGCPLVVHRRCISPMFDISNEIAYQNTMLNETRMLDPDNPQDKEKLDRFYMPSSQWLNAAGSERGGRNHYVEAQGKRVAKIVAHAFAKKPDGPSLFVISPFTTVVAGVKGELDANKPEGVSKDTWKTFLANNIGTVHTFQGKEADEVVFVLGCDKNAPGAVQFVGLNIVNVAASRAKHRLYVVGDYNVWQRNEHVATMKRILDTAWVKHWKAYLETGDPAELLLASQMCPTLESLSFVDDDLDTAQVEEWIKSNNPDSELPSLDTSSYIKNLGPLLGELDLEHYYEFYGFAADEEFENLLFPSVDDVPEVDRKLIPEKDRELILNNLKCAKLFYDISCAVASSDLLAELIKADFSGCLMYLTRAVEIYLQAYALPLLGKDGEAPTKKGKSKSPSVGQYASYLNQKRHKELLAERTLRGIDGDEDAAALRGTSEKWWAGLAKSIEKFAEKRNLACHPEKRKDITAEVIAEARDLLCKGPLFGEEACEAPVSDGGDAPADTPATGAPAPNPLAMSEGDVFAAALRGMENEPDEPREGGEGEETAAACGAEGEPDSSCDPGEGADESAQITESETELPRDPGEGADGGELATEGEHDSSCNPGEGESGETVSECGTEDKPELPCDPGEGEDTVVVAMHGTESGPEVTCDLGVDKAAAVVVSCGSENEHESPSESSVDAQVTVTNAQDGAVEPAEDSTSLPSGEAGVEAPSEVETGAEVAGACEPLTDLAACSDTSPVPSPEPGVASLPEVEETSEPSSEPQSCETSEAPFSLEDARSEKDDGCLAFSSINKGGRCAALLDKLHPEGPMKGNAAATLVLNWLDSRGYIETRSFEQVEGRYPTAKGYAVGIRWRLYPNERTGGLGTGIVFNEAAQKWLVEEVPGLVANPDGSPGR